MFKSNKDKWLTTTATVTTATWIWEDTETGYHWIVYSYHANGTLYEGEFRDMGSPNEYHLKQNDTLQIRYNPAKPHDSYYPNALSPNKFVLKLTLVMTGMCLAVALIVYLVRTLSGDR